MPETCVVLLMTQRRLVTSRLCLPMWPEAEVGGPGRDGGHRGSRRGGHGDVPAGLPGLVADQRAAQRFGVVEGVVVVADGGLAEPAAVVGDDPVADLQQGRDLLIDITRFA